MALIDSNPLMLSDGNYFDTDRVATVGHSFMGNGRYVDRVVLKLKRNGTLTTGRCYIYAHSGTYGTNSVRTGSPLAASVDVDLSTLSNTVYENVSFQFDGSLFAASGTAYVLTFNRLNDHYTTQYVQVAANDDNTHSGNSGFSNALDTTYTPSSSSKIVFEVHDTKDRAGNFMAFF